MQLKPNTVTSNRIIYTPSAFARSSLLYLQEVGTLQALLSHKSSRENLSSYLFFTVLSGGGSLTYGGELYQLHQGDSVFNSILFNLLVLLMKDSWNPENVQVIGKRTQLSEIKNYIDENYASAITLDSLSALFFINKTYLSEIYKEQYGIGMNEYLVEKRITKAKELLRFTDKTLEEISIEVGVNGAAYLSRIFKKIESVSPTEYRKMWR